MKALIPARGGSKRIPNKNIVDLNGKPLISYTIATSLSVVDEVFVSTDSPEIENVAKECGAKVIKRPPEISGDFSSTNSVIEHFLNTVDDVNYFVCVQPTSPLLPATYLQRGLNRIATEDYNSIISVTRGTHFFWNCDHEPINFDREKRLRTQDMEPWYAENGAFYITSRNDFLETKNIINGKVGFVVMPKSTSFEIDDYEDLKIIQSILKHQDMSK